MHENSALAAGRRVLSVLLVVVGFLAMKVYGYLRNQHLASMARLVKFELAASNIVPLPSVKMR